jgi:hypothetical protein
MQREDQLERPAGATNLTVLLRVLDELHDDGVAVGERHLRAGQPGVHAVEELLGSGVELDGVAVHVLQALPRRRLHALRRDAAQRGEPVERNLPRPKPVQSLQHQTD